MQRLALRSLSSAGSIWPLRALSVSSRAASPLFCLQTHTWLQKSTEGIARVGLTEIALDDIGEVEALKHLVEIGSTVAAGDDLVRVDWEAMHISDGDELYHTKWANVSGDHTLKAPCAGTVVAFNVSALRSSRLGSLLEADEWLVEMAVDGESLRLLSDEAEYVAAAREQGSGRFCASDDSLKYTSYG